MENFIEHNYRIIDCHNHVGGKKDERSKLNIKGCERMLKAANSLGFERLCVSRPMSGGWPTPEQFSECNEVVIEAIERYPDRLLGYAFVNPGYIREAVDEVKRCVEEYGMIGVKLYNQYFINEPVVFPLIEECIDMEIPILVHAGRVMDKNTKKKQPKISDGTHFAKAAQEYPEAIFIQGHIGGGGDWEYSIKAIKESPSVYLDTSGSVVDDGMIDMAFRELGTERILFGTDGIYEGGLGKVMGADLSDSERKAVFEDNMQKILDRRNSQ